MDYIFTRLSIDKVSSLYLGTTPTKNILEIRKTKIILDNEKNNVETEVEINLSEFNYLKEYFESIHGVTLPTIEIDKLNIVERKHLSILENDEVTISIEKSISEITNEEIYTITMSSKKGSLKNTIEINEKVYSIFSGIEK